jgi:hypothetical protein
MKLVWQIDWYGHVRAIQTKCHIFLFHCLANDFLLESKSTATTLVHNPDSIHGILAQLKILTTSTYAQTPHRWWLCSALHRDFIQLAYRSNKNPIMEENSVQWSTEVPKRLQQAKRFAQHTFLSSTNPISGYCTLYQMAKFHERGKEYIIQRHEANQAWFTSVKSFIQFNSAFDKWGQQANEVPGPLAIHHWGMYEHKFNAFS